MASQFVNWIKSPAGRAYFFSTHFWGPVANWGLPLAALADMQKDASLISGVMTPTMAGYSSIFMAFAWQVRPRNYLLFACHATNATAQLVQTGRFVNYWYMGGAEEAEKKAALVNSSATLTELSKLPGTIAKDADQVAANASSAMIKGKAETEHALAQATAQAEAVFAKTRDEGRVMVSSVQSGLDAAQAHIRAGGRDILDRGEEIAKEAKRELGVAQKEVEKVEKKKGWFN